jgi:hypothetical protein
MMKSKEFTAIRKWVGENTDVDQSTVFRKLYDTALEYLKPQSVPMLILTLSKYQYQAAFAADHEINLMACLTELMMELDFA